MSENKNTIKNGLIVTVVGGLILAAVNALFPSLWAWLKIFCIETKTFLFVKIDIFIWLYLLLLSSLSFLLYKIFKFLLSFFSPKISANAMNCSGITTSTNTKLDKTEERILKYLSGSNEVNIGEFQGYMPEIDDYIINFYIKELVRKKYIKKSRKFPLIWLDDKGEQYLIQNNLIRP